jgi:hypothetical protein
MTWSPSKSHAHCVAGGTVVSVNVMTLPAPTAKVKLASTRSVTTKAVLVTGRMPFKLSNTVSVTS